MKIIKTGLNITKAIRNIGRLREIVTIFAKNGFEEFMAMGIASRIPNFVLPKSAKNIRQELQEVEGRHWGKIVGLRLRKCFEELGPAFIKFGQLLSSREDIFPEEFIEEMRLLRDQVKEVPFSEIRSALENSLGAKIEDRFSEFNEKPIGTASIGAAYKARLKTGESVVVKVRRPNIARMIEMDFSILLFLVGQIEKASQEIKFLGLTRVIKDFSATLQNELNFHIEAQNGRKFRELLSGLDAESIFYIPQVYAEYTREDVIVMEFLDGIPFSRTVDIQPHLPQLKEKLTTGVKLFMRSFLQGGFFHADLHGGNFFYLTNGKIGIVDFGLMGTLSRKSRQNFLAIVYALLTSNFENLVYEFLDVAEYDQVPDIDILISDVRETLSPYIGLTVQQSNYSEVFKSIMQALNRHQLFLPRDWFVVFRALITLDGTGKSIGLDFDIFGILESDIKGMVKASINKDAIVEDLMWASRDVIPAFRIFPRHLRWFIKDLAKKNYVFEVKNIGYESHLNNIARSIAFLGFSIAATGLALGGNNFIQGSNLLSMADVPTITWIFWMAGFATFVRGLFVITKR